MQEFAGYDVDDVVELEDHILDLADDMLVCVNDILYFVDDSGVAVVNKTKLEDVEQKMIAVSVNEQMVLSFDFVQVVNNYQTVLMMVAGKNWKDDDAVEVVDNQLKVMLHDDVDDDVAVVVNIHLMVEINAKHPLMLY